MTTYTKLRDKSWGLRSTDTLTPGATIVVSKRDGSTTTEMVGRILWQGGGVTLASIGRTSAVTSTSYRGSRRRSGSYECDECGNYVTPGTRCWETGHTH